MRFEHQTLAQHVSFSTGNGPRDLAADPAVSGILLQLPVPEGLDSAALIERIPAGKDIDGLTTLSAGLPALGMPGLRPCTPSGVIELLDSESIRQPGPAVRAARLPCPARVRALAARVPEALSHGAGPGLE